MFQQPTFWYVKWINLDTPIILSLNTISPKDTWKKEIVHVIASMQKQNKFN